MSVFVVAGSQPERPVHRPDCGGHWCRDPDRALRSSGL